MKKYLLLLLINLILFLVTILLIGSLLINKNEYVSSIENPIQVISINKSVNLNDNTENSEFYSYPKGKDYSYNIYLAYQGANKKVSLYNSSDTNFVNLQMQLTKYLIVLKKIYQNNRQTDYSIFLKFLKIYNEQ